VKVLSRDRARLAPAEHVELGDRRLTELLDLRLDKAETRWRAPLTSLLRLKDLEDGGKRREIGSFRGGRIGRQKESAMPVESGGGVLPGSVAVKRRRVPPGKRLMKGGQAGLDAKIEAGEGEGERA
jgi:hypothetical protein